MAEPTASESKRDALAVAERVGDALREREATLAVAESVTGGLVSSLLTDVPGASDYVDRGFVVYAYDAKRQVLGVDRESLDAEGAVSESVARAMATGARDIADVVWAVSTTGVAGPTGGTHEKPVGTVFTGIAYAAPWGTEGSCSDVKRHTFEGDRGTIKLAAARTALEHLEEAIANQE